MNNSNLKGIKEELLVNQNAKLKDECIFLREKFVTLKKRISQKNLEPLHPENFSNQKYELTMKKLKIYENDYISMSKTINDLSKNSNIAVLEQNIKTHQETIKILEKSNYKLNLQINKPADTKESEFECIKELSKLKSSIVEIEGNLSENVLKIEKKSKSIKDLEKECGELMSKSGYTNGKKKPIGLCNADELMKRLKAIQNSFASNQVKFIQVITQSEETLAELKKTEIILQATLIKKQQQFRLINAIDKDFIAKSLTDEKTSPDVNFYYKPAIKHLYI